MEVVRRLYRFGEYSLDPAERLLLRDGEPVSLTPKCFDLLVVLVENSGHLVEKEALLERLWPDQFVEEANLSFTISSLRKVLGQEKNGPRFIETVPKKGFRFSADVEELRHDDEARSKQDTRPPVEITPTPVNPPSRTGIWRLGISIVAAIVLTASFILPSHGATAPIRNRALLP